jgi:hypothetical protein
MAIPNTSAAAASHLRKGLRENDSPTIRKNIVLLLTLVGGVGQRGELERNRAVAFL